MVRRGGVVSAALSVAAAVVTLSATQIYQENLPARHPAIGYFQATPDDPVSHLAARVARGTATLRFRDDGAGYLASVLEQLGVNPDSQALVFSKTSLQSNRISPRRPRAIYFSDDVSVGFVQGGEFLEFAARDPTLGTIFYTLNNREPTRPAFTRRYTCLRCHQGPATAGVPGIFVSSVYPSLSGIPERAGAIVTDHRTAFRDRWGGWYVNGFHGESRHRGNAVALNPAAPDVLDTAGTNSRADLAGLVDARRYMSPVSDIVALLTFEHQTQVTNLLTRLGWEARIAQYGPAVGERSVRLQFTIEQLVAYMLFADEVPFSAPVHGVSTFSRTFPKRGPHDRRGRSLRDFDLRTRLFRYPLSFMVYDAAFDALPDAVRAEVYRRLYAVLTGEDRRPQFGLLTDDERRAILEILIETKFNVPDYWRQGRSTSSPPRRVP